MSFTIAITGKGGVGKTTLAALIVQRLIAHGCQPVLAVDADPNTNLDQALGVKAGKTVGGVREEARQIAGEGAIPAGVTKQQLLELKIAESLVEAADFDLIAMGRPEGPGCYCYANNVLKVTIAEIAKNYPYIVIDNEAGLENLSRRIVQKVDLLLLVADPSARGLATLRRLYDLAREMQIDYKRLILVINRLRKDELPAQVPALRQATAADFALGLPDDAELAEFGENGRSLQELPAANPVVRRLDDLLQQTGLFLP